MAPSFYYRMAAGVTSSLRNLGFAGCWIDASCHSGRKKNYGEDDHRGIKIIKQLN
jgi:hypothetical protein